MASDHAHGQPVALTDEHTELEIERGDAYQRTSGPVVWVDARCKGCRGVRVCTLTHPSRALADGGVFAAACRTCGGLTPHYAISLLRGLNRKRERGYQNDD